MKKLAVIILATFVMGVAPVFAVESLSDVDAKVIKEAGISVYPDAIYVYGNQELGIRFATTHSPEKVREWYVKQLPGWSIMDEYGIWIIYEGKPVLGGEVMLKKRIVISMNEDLPEWYSLDKNMTTDIVIMIPKSE